MRTLTAKTALLIVTLSLIVLFLVCGCQSGEWPVVPTPVGTEPAIRITSVKWKENLAMSIAANGQVYNVDPADYKISAWIRVNYSWWPKPYLDSPWTWIGSDNRWWTANMVTGGEDEKADAVRVFLVKKSTTWKPGQNKAPVGDIVAEDMAFKPLVSGIDARGVSHELIVEDK